MPSRRGFLAGLLAAGALPGASWADAGSPAYLSAARRADGRFALYGLGGDGALLFSLPLPGRGHAAAAHPRRPEAVAFARRPGTFAIVLDCASGQELTRLTAPPGHHFYGHGAFSADGALLFTTENAFEDARGMIGIWDAARGYRRLGGFASHGIGPHEIRRLPGQEVLVVANGGIETHPASGRAKLNIPTMRPSLAYLDFGGALLDQVAPETPLARNSLRHLAICPDGRVAVAAQWQGDMAEAPPLLALHRRGAALHWLSAPEPLHRAMRGYAGSVAATAAAGTAAVAGDSPAAGTTTGATTAATSATGQVAITSPRGGLVQVFDLDGTGYADSWRHADICGIAPAPRGFLLTAGTGDVGGIGTDGWSRHPVAWDNHLVPVGT
ncbi:DUF1513 domain-containing protein [Pseudooceanicola aestuarii]|uniref:DUF1513 domain-containing protein n=1 Tax=Pseudooceanicola aestuarii TaxID=2697319 RepID=UPI0013D56645|nr:DUF1513 domain-containing protein [Pseudooceanicola aestuarii]